MPSVVVTLVPSLIAATVLVARPPALRAQGSEVRGRVVSETGEAIPGATITLAGIRYTVRADSLGQFRLAGTPGSTLTFTLRAPGFRDDSGSVVLARGRAVSRDFVMTSETVPLPEANPSDRVLRGQVTDQAGEPIAYANVQLNGGRRFVTDDLGRFLVPLTISGRFSLLVRRIGYAPEELKLEQSPDTAVRVSMQAVARALPGQVVTTRAPFARLENGGFYRRMAEVERGARVGYFVTPEELQLRNPQNVTDAVEQFPNIRLRPIDDGVIGPDGMAHGDGVPLARKMRIEDRSGCPLTVYLDRVRIQPTTVSAKPVDTEINSVVQPHTVSGIEVYPRALGAPSEFHAVNGTCGVVVIWSK